MIEKMKYYLSEIQQVQTNIQDKLDSIEVTDYNEDVVGRRESMIDSLDEIIETLEEVVSLIESYNVEYQRGGLKSIK